MDTYEDCYYDEQSQLQHQQHQQGIQQQKDMLAGSSGRTAPVTEEAESPSMMEHDGRNPTTTEAEGKIGRASGIEDDDFASSVSQFSGSTDQGNCFEIVKHDAKELYLLVKALAFREYCTLVVNNEGIRLVVDDQHNQQASAYFKYEQFSDFNLRVIVCNLRIPINVFMETLNMFASNTAVFRMWYEGEGCPLMICIEDEGIVVQVAIKTMNLQSMLDFEFDNSCMLCKAILNPIPVREILRDFDATSETMVITFTPNYLSFYTVGGLGKIKVEIPSTSDHMEHLSCKEERISFQYRIILIKRMAECARLCNKISFRIDQRGVLSVQLLIPQHEQVVFVEFFSVADDDVYHPDTS